MGPPETKVIFKNLKLMLCYYINFLAPPAILRQRKNIMCGGKYLRFGLSKRLEINFGGINSNQKNYEIKTSRSLKRSEKASSRSGT